MGQSLPAPAHDEPPCKLKGVRTSHMCAECNSEIVKPEILSMWDGGLSDDVRARFEVLKEYLTPSFSPTNIPINKGESDKGKKEVN